MEQVTLGRTGMKVSRLGLGGGGHSRLGKRTGIDEQDSIALVRRAIERGVNFIDTAESYGTEEIIGHGIRGLPRDRLILSTKKSLGDGQLITAAELRAGLEASLRRLDTDYVEVYHLHGLKTDQYDRAMSTLIPEMVTLKREGKIRAIGVTEAFNSDRGHEMLSRAMRDDCWDVIMVGFSILNQSARELVLKPAMEKNIGALCMFAVRVALSQPQKLREIVQALLASGEMGRSVEIDPNDPLGFITQSGAAASIPQAAYRFCRDEPGMHVVLSGTGNIEHLESNIRAIESPPLPAEIRDRLVRLFQNVMSVSGQ